MCFGRWFTQQQHFGGLKMQRFSNDSKFFKTILLLFPCKLQKKKKLRNEFLWKLCMNNRPGMNNTVFLAVFTDSHEQGSFWQCCRLYAKRFENTKEKLLQYLLHHCHVNIQVWKNSRLSKWWQNLNFWENYSLKD